MASQGENSNVNNNSATEKVTALIVEDNMTCRMIHTAILKSQGFETCVVESAQEAINLFRDGREFDVVFIDICYNGIQVTKELRKLGVTSMIIGVEVNAPRWDAQELIDAGIDRFYEKPLRNISIALIHEEFIKMKNDN